MARPAHVTHVTFGGIAPQGEIWQTGFWMFADFATPDLANAAALVVYNALNGTGDLFAVLKAQLSTSHNLNHVRLYSYAVGGTTASQIGEYVPTTPAAGTNGTASQLPLQAAAVMTFHTATPGRRGRGRMYLPWSVPGVSAGGQANPAVFQTITDAFAKTITDMLSNSAWTAARPVVVSVAGGTTANINRASMDTRFDVQRRRANKQAIVGSASTALPF